MKTTEEKIAYLRFKIKRKQYRKDSIEDEIKELRSKLDHQLQLLDSVKK